jgi:hypothetical protein
MQQPRKSPDFARIVNVKNWNRLNNDDDEVILVVSLMNLTVTSPLLLLMNMILIVS